MDDSERLLIQKLLVKEARQMIYKYKTHKNKKTAGDDMKLKKTLTITMDEKDDIGDQLMVMSQEEAAHI